MRTLLAFFLLGVASVTLAAERSAVDTLGAFHAAMKAGQRDVALALLADDVLIFESGHIERGRAEYAAQHFGNDVAFAAATQRTVKAQTVHAQGALAVVVAETETTGKWKDKDVHLIGTETVVLEQLKGQWLIRHVHWSSRKAH